MSKIQVVRSSMPPFEDYVEEIRDIWESRWLTHTGPKHQHLQKELEKYLGVPHLSLFANGHLALEAALSLLPVGSEVITTPYTFASTTQAIVHCGMIPVFCDIDPVNMTMNPNCIEDLITEKTSAVVPVHVYGNICDDARIGDIAQRHNLKVIYDAAHAFGECVNGVPVGNLGDISMFSFHATKVFHTVEGGGLAFKNSKLDKEFAAWRQFGMYGKEDAEKIGTNAKMTEFHAAMGLCNLKYIDGEIELRCKAAQQYRKRISGIDGISLCPEQPNVTYNYAYFPVLFDKEKFGKSRDEVSKQLEQRGIFSRKYFYPQTSDFSVYQKMFTIQETPIADKIAKQVLTLPLYAGLSLDDVNMICDIILSED